MNAYEAKDRPTLEEAYSKLLEIQLSYTAKLTPEDFDAVKIIRQVAMDAEKTRHAEIIAKLTQQPVSSETPRVYENNKKPGLFSTAPMNESFSATVQQKEVGSSAYLIMR